MDLTIKPVTKDNVNDYLYFFDNMQFKENSDWNICYCYSYHFIGTAEEWNNKEKNRDSAYRLIREGKMRGYLAYKDNMAIGWCNANDKMNYERLRLYDDIRTGEPQNIGSIVCFVIDPRYRNQKVATNLLKRVCDDYKEKGYRMIEAYPEKKTCGMEDHFAGPLSMYMKQNFKIIKEFDNYYIIQKQLNDENKF